MAISAETLNKELGYVSATLNDAPHLFRALADYRPPRIPWQKVSKRKRKRPITEEEDARLLEALRAPRQPREQPTTTHARREIADIFEINLNTGMRGGETVKLTWTQVNFNSGEIYLRKTKNGEGHYVPINSRVRAILLERFVRRTSQYVFPNPEGTGPRYNYSKTFRRVAEALGLPYGQRLDYGFTMYSTRHTATTRMLRAGNDVSAVQEVVGHSDRTMTLVYSHASSETRKRAVESLVRRKRAKYGKKKEAAG
jgi:integrase